MRAIWGSGNSKDAILFARHHTTNAACVFFPVLLSFFRWKTGVIFLSRSDNRILHRWPRKRRTLVVTLALLLILSIGFGSVFGCCCCWDRRMEARKRPIPKMHSASMAAVDTLTRYNWLASIDGAGWRGWRPIVVFSLKLIYNWCCVRLLLEANWTFVGNRPARIAWLDERWHRNRTYLKI